MPDTEARDQEWLEQFEKLKSWVEGNSSQLPTKKTNLALDKWLKKQQQSYQCSSESHCWKWRKPLLVKLGIELKSGTEVWTETYERLKKFMGENNGKHPTNETNFGLARWVYSQREGYRKAVNKRRWDWKLGELDKLGLDIRRAGEETEEELLGKSQGKVEPPEDWKGNEVLRRFVFKQRCCKQPLCLFQDLDRHLPESVKLGLVKTVLKFESDSKLQKCNSLYEWLVDETRFKIPIGNDDSIEICNRALYRIFDLNGTYKTYVQFFINHKPDIGDPEEARKHLFMRDYFREFEAKLKEIKQQNAKQSTTPWLYCGEDMGSAYKTYCFDLEEKGKPTVKYPYFSHFWRLYYPHIAPGAPSNPGKAGAALAAKRKTTKKGGKKGGSKKGSMGKAKEATTAAQPTLVSDSNNDNSSKERPATRTKEVATEASEPKAKAKPAAETEPEAKPSEEQVVDTKTSASEKGGADEKPEQEESVVRKELKRTSKSAATLPTSTYEQEAAAAVPVAATAVIVMPDKKKALRPSKLSERAPETTPEPIEESEEEESEEKESGATGSRPSETRGVARTHMEKKAKEVESSASTSSTESSSDDDSSDEDSSDRDSSDKDSSESEEDDIDKMDQEERDRMRRRMIRRLAKPKPDPKPQPRSNKRRSTTPRLTPKRKKRRAEPEPEECSISEDSKDEDENDDDEVEMDVPQYPRRLRDNHTSHPMRRKARICRRGPVYPVRW